MTRTRFRVWILALALTSGAPHVQAQAVFVDFGSEWRFLRGRAAPSSPSTAWREPVFDDSGWEVGRAGFGYGDGDDTTVLLDMPGHYTSLFLRRSFTVSDPAAVERLVLAVRYDDAFVCYLNGVEAARSGNFESAGDEPSFAATASWNHEAEGIETYDISGSLAQLSQGENVIAIQGVNVNLLSSDFSLDLRLDSGIDEECPMISRCEADWGSGTTTIGWEGEGNYVEIIVLRDGLPLDGSPFPADSTAVVDADAGDFMHEYEVIAVSENSQCPAVICRPQIEAVGFGAEWAYFRGTEPPSAPADAWREPAFDASSWERGVAGFGYGDADDATLLEDMPNEYVSVFVRKTFVAPNTSLVRNAVLEMFYDDGFVAYLNGEEFVRSGLGQEGESVPFDATAAGNHEGNVAERFSVPVELLLEGENVLAIQGHNVGLESSDFSLHPRMLINVCPELSDVRCTRLSDGVVELTWNPLPFDSIEVLRNGEPIVGSPFPGDSGGVIDEEAPARDLTYAVTGFVDGVACGGAFICQISCCDAGGSLREVDINEMGGRVEARLRWEIPPDVVAIDVFRQGVLLETLDASASEFLDSDVEAGGPLGGLRYDVVFRFADGSRCTQCGFASLCIDNFRCRPTSSAPLEIELTWGESVKSWDGIQLLRNGDVIAELPGTVSRFVDDVDTRPVAFYELVPVSDSGPQPGCTLKCSIDLGEAFRRGDTNDDGVMQLTDAIRVFGALFFGVRPPACPDAGDVDDNGALEITDGIQILNVLFLGAGSVSDPGFVRCGYDLTRDSLGECEASDCL